MAGKAKRNPRAEAVASLDAIADALLRKRLAALKTKPAEASESKADDFSEDDLEALAASLEA